MIQCKIYIRKRLCLNSLCCINNKNRSVAGRQASGHLIVKVHMPGGVDDIEFIVLAVVGVVMLMLSVFLETPALPGTAKVWAAALFLGVFCSGICFVIQSVEQQFTTASHASLIFTLEPVFSAVFAYFLLSERLTVRGYFGAALMLVSLLIMELDVPALLKKDEKAP